MIDLLDFVLPAFVRICWASEAAREVWERRFDRIVSAWEEIVWRAVADGICDCCMVEVSPAVSSTAVSECRKHGLSLAPLPPLSGVGKAATTQVVVGDSDAIRHFCKVWATRDHDSIGRLLGIPKCCREFFQRVKIEHKRLDTTWETATTSRSLANSQHWSIRGLRETNTFWAPLGIRAIPHLPCSFDCAASASLGAQLMEVGARAGFGAEVAWITQILDWPVEWSALHGIAEIKTPILKMAMRTDATASKYSLAWQGEGRAEEGVTGISFPHFVPLRALVTDSSSFRRGLEHNNHEPGSTNPTQG